MKMYTLDNALLVERPEIRIGDKMYPVDDRQKTVEKVIELTQGGNSGQNIGETMRKTLDLVFGPENAKEIDEMNLPFPAYQKLFELVMAAVTGEEPKNTEARFPEADDNITPLV